LFKKKWYPHEYLFIGCPKYRNLTRAKLDLRASIRRQIDALIGLYLIKRNQSAALSLPVLASPGKTEVLPAYLSHPAIGMMEHEALMLMARKSGVLAADRTEI